MLNLKKVLSPSRSMIAAVVATCCFSVPAAAQDPKPMRFCDYQPPLDDLIGEYTVTAGPSRLSSGGTTIPFPKIETYKSTLALIDGVLVMYTDGAPTIDLHPVGSEERDWIGPDNVGGIPVFSTDDMETVMDCDVNSLVRLMGTGIGTSQEGRQFEFTIRLFAVLDGSLVGGNSWTIDGMTMRQRLVFAETGG